MALGLWPALRLSRNRIVSCIYGKHCNCPSESSRVFFFAQRLRACMQFTPGSDRSRSPRLARGSLAPGSANHLTRMFLNILSAPPSLPWQPRHGGLSVSQRHDRWTRPRECTGNREQGLIISVRNTVVDPQSSKRQFSAPIPLPSLTHSAGGHLPGFFDRSKRSNLGSFRIMLPLGSNSQAVSRHMLLQWAPVQRGGN